MLPLSPLVRLVEDFVTTTTACPACHVPAGYRCAGLWCADHAEPQRSPVPRQPAMLLVPASPDRPLTPGEALAKLFMDNADRGANAANDELIEELQQRILALRNTP